MKRYETDVVVVAGGPSGLSAAVQAAESGPRVIVCEKLPLWAVPPTWAWVLWA